MTSDKRSPPTRSRTLDYSWKSCESGAVDQYVSILFFSPTDGFASPWVPTLHVEKVSALRRPVDPLLGKLKLHIVGLATSFLSGSKEEWSLVRRHPSETMFGVQVAGSKPATLVPTAELIARECSGGIDFMDLNCGCPIDLVFRTGSGSARMAVCCVRLKIEC